MTYRGHLTLEHVHIREHMARERREMASMVLVKPLVLVDMQSVNMDVATLSSNVASAYSLTGYNSTRGLTRTRSHLLSFSCHMASDVYMLQSQVTSMPHPLLVALYLANTCS